MTAITYFAGGEDTSFTFVGSVDVNTNSSFFRAGWAREVVEVAGASVSDPPANHALSRKFVNSSNVLVTPSTFWCRAFFAWSALGGGATANAQMLRILDDSGIARLLIRGAPNNAVKISKRDSGGVITDLVTSANNALPTAGLSPAALDLHVINNATVTYGPRTDISFTAGPPGIITTDSGDFLMAGLTVGSTLTISGSAFNNVTATVTSATQTTLSCSATTFTAEAAGSSVSLSTNGLAALFFKTKQVAAFAGEIRTESVSAMAQIDLCNCLATDTIRWSEAIVSNQDTRLKGLWTRPPVAAGATQNWLPNTVADINKTVIDDTTFISTTGTAEISSWTGSQTAPPGDFVVDGIIVEARLAVNPTGPQHVEYFANVAGTGAVAGSIGPSNALSNFAWIWAENPATAGDWVLTDITMNVLDLGVESLA